MKNPTTRDLEEEGRKAMRIIREIAEIDSREATTITAAILQTIIVLYSKKEKWLDLLEDIFKQTQASIADFKARSEE